MAKNPCLTNVEALEPLVGSIVIYAWQNQHIYVNRVDGAGGDSGVMYLQCHNDSCSSRLVCSPTSMVPTILEPHNHPPLESDYIDQLRFRAELRRRVLAEPNRIVREIYEEVAKEPRFKEAVAKVRKWSSLERMLLRVRKLEIEKGSGEMCHQDKKKTTSQLDSGRNIKVESVTNTASTSEVLSERIHRESLQAANAHQQAERVVSTPGELINKTTSSRDGNETSSDFTNLKCAINKLELISDKLAAASFVDSYDQFGKYIGSLLRDLPQERVQKIMEKIVSDVLSIKLSIGVQSQPTDPTSDPLTETFSVTQAPATTVLNTAHVFSSQGLFERCALSKEDVLRSPPVILKSPQPVSPQKCPAPSTNMTANMLTMSRPTHVVNLEKSSTAVKRVTEKELIIKKEDVPGSSPAVIARSVSSGQPSHLFSCDRCSTPRNYFHSSNSLKAHFALAHPGFNPSFKTRATKGKDTSNKKAWTTLDYNVQL